MYTSIVRALDVQVMDILFTVDARAPFVVVGGHGESRSEEVVGGTKTSLALQYARRVYFLLCLFRGFRNFTIKGGYE